MKSTRLIAAIVLLATLIYFGCKKSTKSDDVITYTPEVVTATISGRVVDNGKSPVSGATVKVGALTATTDVNGVFSIANASVDKNAGFVKVEKDGFFLGTKTIVVKSGKDNKVAIQLIKKTVAGTFKGTDGGTVTIPAAGGTIVFPNGSIVNSTTKAPYTGIVTVNAFYYNPTEANFIEIIPGSLRGLNANNQETGLQSFSMVAVELSGAAGEKLQLAEGKPASIEFTIPNGLLAQAPATIPLWYLDETNGLWKEEGAATKQDNKYIGQVKHFSFWNCDAPFPLVEFSAVIKTQQAAPLTDGTVVIRATTGASDGTVIYGSGYINPDGAVGGKIPANRAFTMIVYNKCGNELYKQNIGPFTADKDLGTITVNAGNPINVSFSGTVLDCNQQPVSNGFVTIRLEGQTYRATINNGKYSLSISRCSNVSTNAIVTAYNQTSNEIGTSFGYDVTDQPITTGMLSACGAPLEQYVNYSFNGVKYSFTAPPDSAHFNVILSNINVTDTIANIYAVKSGGGYGPQFNTYIRGGTINPTLISLMIYVGSGKHIVSTQPMKVTYTEYGNIGRYVSGNFSGLAIDSSRPEVPYPFSCDFRLIRR